MKKWLLAISTVILLLGVLLTACGNENETPTPTLTATPTSTPTASPTPTPKPDVTKNLNIGGVPGTSSTHPFFVAMSQVLNDAIADINFTLIDTSGSQTAMNGMIEKNYDFGQSLASVEDMVYLGISPWTTANTDVRRLCSWSTQTLTIVVSESSGIQSIAELQDKNIRVGTTGSLTETFTGQIFGALEITPKYSKSALTNLANDLKSAAIDGFAVVTQSGSADATITAVQQEVPLKFLSFSSEDIQKVKTKYSYMTTGKIASGLYNNEAEIDTFTIVATVATIKDNLSEDEAYRIVKALWEGKDTLSNAYAPFTDYNLPQETIDTSLVPLHSGAIKYFREMELSIPDALVPPESAQS